MLQNKKVTACVKKAIAIFFSAKKDMQNKTLLWDTLKAYIREVYINQKAYINKCQLKASMDLLNDIAKLETQHNRLAEESVKKNLDLKISKLKLLQTTQAAKSILYTRQQYFEYRYILNRLLARVLAQDYPKASISEHNVNRW